MLKSSIYSRAQWIMCLNRVQLGTSQKWTGSKWVNNAPVWCDQKMAEKSEGGMLMEVATNGGM